MTSLPPSAIPQAPAARRRTFLSSDWPFFVLLSVLGGTYVLLILALLTADALYTSPRHFFDTLRQPEILASIRLTLISCTAATILALWVAVPLGYLLSRFRFPGRWLIDAIVDTPLVLPPLVLGLSLLILFHLPVGGGTLELWLQRRLGWHVTLDVPAVILAQFTVAGAFAIRSMRLTFDQMNPRAEDVARTLGCSRGQAFLRVVLPQAQRGIFAAAALSWARSLGEFGPILVFAGATRMRTEVLSTTVFLEISIGNLQAAVAVSLLMVALAMLVLGALRFLGAGLYR